MTNKQAVLLHEKANLLTQKRGKTSTKAFAAEYRIEVHHILFVHHGS